VPWITPPRVFSGRSDPTGGPGATARQAGWQPDISSNLSYIGVSRRSEIASGLRESSRSRRRSTCPRRRARAAQAPARTIASRGVRLAQQLPPALPAHSRGEAGKTDRPTSYPPLGWIRFRRASDYNSIMGNTGGDNRAEFDTRLSHALWYESPNWGVFNSTCWFHPDKRSLTYRPGLWRAELHRRQQWALQRRLVRQRL